MRETYKSQCQEHLRMFILLELGRYTHNKKIYKKNLSFVYESEAAYNAHEMGIFFMVFFFSKYNVCQSHFAWILHRQGEIIYFLLKKFSVMFCWSRDKTHDSEKNYLNDISFEVFCVELIKLYLVMRNFWWMDENWMKIVCSLWIKSFKLCPLCLLMKILWIDI